MRAGVYARISKDTEGESLGVERQLEDCRNLCVRRGWDIVDEYIDNDISAWDPKKVRPQHKRLMQDIKAGRLDAVVVWAVDRLYRQPRELEPFLDACESVGLTTLANVAGDIDLNDEGAIAMLRIQVTFANMETVKTSKRIKRQRIQLAQAGKSAGGLRPFGFEGTDKVTGRKSGTEVRESEAKYIREAVNSILDGESLSSIVRKWNDPVTGIPSVTGVRWTNTVIRKLLKTPRIAGLRQHQGEILRGVKTVWPAIIDEVTWLKVVKVLDNPDRRPISKSKEPRRYPLRGILVCSQCSKPLTGWNATTGGKSMRAYSCRKQTGGCGSIFIRAENAESWVLERLVPLADNPKVRELVSQAAGQDVEKLRTLRAEIADYESEIAQAVTDRVAGGITQSILGQLTKGYEVEIGKREALIASIHAQSTLDKYPIGSIASHWDDLSVADQRSIILTIVEHITVGSGRGSGPVFNPKRMQPKWRLDAIGKLVDWTVVWPKVVAGVREILKNQQGT